MAPHSEWRVNCSSTLASGGGGLGGATAAASSAAVMLRCLPLLKACNQQVDYIDKRHCNLFSVPDDVLRYTDTLEELMLDANQIRELPRVCLPSLYYITD